MSKTEKKFDAVALMRAARDRISAEIEGMTLEEELKWLASQEINDPYLKQLRDRVLPNNSMQRTAPRAVADAER